MSGVATGRTLFGEDECDLTLPSNSSERLAGLLSTVRILDDVRAAAIQGIEKSHTRTTHAR